MKRKILTISLVVSFIGLAVFGFLLMHGISNNYVGLCVAALGGGTGFCPHGNLTAAYFHMNAFRSFSNILPAALTAFLILITALLVFNSSLGLERRETAFSAFWIPATSTTSLFALAAPLGRWFTLREREAAA